MIETGVVKVFFGTGDRRYGFLTVDESGEDIFFHFNDGRNMKAGRDRPEWCDPPRGKGLWDPKPGNEVVFRRARGTKGSKASPWTYKSLYKRALREIASRPRYRVVTENRAVGVEEWSDSSVAWEGTDLEDPKLTRLWDPQHDRENFSCGDFHSRKWFEISIDGEWSYCRDPRI